MFIPVTSNEVADDGVSTHLSTGSTTHVPVVTQLSMEEIFPCSVRFVEDHFQHLAHTDSCIASTPPANGVGTSHTISQLDNHTQEAIASLLSFAAAPPAFQHTDDDIVLESEADPTFGDDFCLPYLPSPTVKSTIPTSTLLLFPTVAAIEHIPPIQLNIFTLVTSQFYYGIHTPRGWQLEAIDHALFEEDPFYLSIEERLVANPYYR